MISATDGSLRKKDVEDRRLSIIDVSSADDSLLDSVSGNTLNQQQPSENQEHADLLYTPNSKKFEDAASKLEEWEHEPPSNDETSEIGKPKKNTKCNLRKSLAWDSAFFTSAGVLDPEELSIIIEGVEKDEKHALPGIQEDVYKSCESVSTLESDSLTLESLEVEGDLFEDIRASIQKSSNNSNLANGNTKVPSNLGNGNTKVSSNLGNGNTKVPSGRPGFQTHDSSKKVGVVSHNKMKAPPAPKNPSAGMRGSGNMIKKNPIFPQLTQKPVAPRRESSISKQSKVPLKSNPSSTISSKRVLLGDLRVKSDKDKAKRIIGDKVNSTSKASVIGGSRGIVPKPTQSSKSPSGPSVSTKTKSATSTSSAINLSDNIGKSPLNSINRKVNGGALKPISCSPAVRTPSRTASRNKSEPGNSSLSGLMSVTKLSSSISPASSFSDWSSESSSSTSMAKHMWNSSRSSVDSSSSRKVVLHTDADQGTNSHIPQSDSSLEGQEAHHTELISQRARTAPGGTALPSALMKPSGLRLPSPKIGFFDGVKSSGRTPRRGMQPQSLVLRGLPIHGAGSPSGGQNKAKLGKLQPARSIMSIENTKPNNQQNSHSNPFHESSDVAIKASSAVQNVKSTFDIPMCAMENVENASPSYDLHPLKGVNNQENAHYDNQVDCLSEKVELMDMNLETQEKFNGDSLCFLQTDISFQDKSNDLELLSHKELIDCPTKEELLNGTSIPSLSVSPTSFDMTASIRRPFAVKDSFCNMDGSVFTETKVSEVKLINLPVPSTIIKENN